MRAPRWLSGGLKKDSPKEKQLIFKYATILLSSGQGWDSNSNSSGHHVEVRLLPPAAPFTYVSTTGLPWTRPLGFCLGLVFIFWMLLFPMRIILPAETLWQNHIRAISLRRLSVRHNIRSLCDLASRLHGLFLSSGKIKRRIRWKTCVVSLTLYWRTPSRRRRREKQPVKMTAILRHYWTIWWNKLLVSGLE